MAIKNFGSLKIDDNHRVISSGCAIQTSDASGTPKTSPLAYSNITLIIEIPMNAAEVVFTSSTNMRISELPAMTSYYVHPANQTQAYGVADMDNIYIVRDAADGVLNFYFVLV